MRSIDYKAELAHSDKNFFNFYRVQLMNHYKALTHQYNLAEVTAATYSRMLGMILWILLNCTAFVSCIVSSSEV